MGAQAGRRNAGRPPKAYAGRCTAPLRYTAFPRCGIVCGHVLCSIVLIRGDRCKPAVPLEHRLPPAEHDPTIYCRSAFAGTVPRMRVSSPPSRWKEPGPGLRPPPLRCGSGRRAPTAHHTTCIQSASAHQQDTRDAPGWLQHTLLPTGPVGSRDSAAAQIRSETGAPDRQGMRTHIKSKWSSINSAPARGCVLQARRVMQPRDLICTTCTVYNVHTAPGPTIRQHRG